MSSETPSLDEFVEEDGLAPFVEKAFPTKDSLKWFVRHNKEALVSSFAMIVVAGRFMYHPERFQRTVVEIGQKAALKGKERAGAKNHE